MKKDDEKKILIIRLSALGDTIHTLPLAAAIKKEYPDIIIDWVVEDKASKFVLNNPLINKVYEIPKRKWKTEKNKIKNFIEFLKIIKEIRKEQYNIVIDTQQLLKSSIIMGLSGGKRKIALDGGREFSFIFANEIIKTHKKQFDVNYHVVNRNLEIAKYLGCQNPTPEFILPDFSKEYSSEIKNITERLDKTKKTITIAPATTWENKHWTVEGWQEVINYYCEKNNIIITASENEKVLTSKILEKISNKSKIIDLTGKTNLADLVYIFKISDLLITPDSGSAHIAWAVNHPKIVTLFFATSPNRNAPFGEKYKFIQSEIECSPCMKKKCRLKTDKIRCKKQIKPIEVINIVNEVLQ